MRLLLRTPPIDEAVYFAFHDFSFLIIAVRTGEGVLIVALVIRFDARNPHGPSAVGT